MQDHAFSSETSFKQAFDNGLISLLNKHQSAGTFILALANFIQHPSLLNVNQPLVKQTYSKLAQQYQLAKEQGLTPDDAADDYNVMSSLIKLGLDNISPLKHRSCGDEKWSLYFNQLRSFRPERMSATHIESINIDFDKNTFNFNKPFLKKEIFIEQQLNNKQASLLYNKFPFADYHGLLVLEREQEFNQFLSEEIFHYIYQLFQDISQTLPEQIIAYNSIGAGASVNHLHFQSCLMKQPLSLFDKQWTHNNGLTEYPAPCKVFNQAENSWAYINKLQSTNTPFNLIFYNQRLYCLPRKLNNQINSSIPQIGWFEMAGGFSLPNRTIFDSIGSTEIARVLKDVCLLKV